MEYFSNIEKLKKNVFSENDNYDDDVFSFNSHIFKPSEQAKSLSSKFLEIAYRYVKNSKLLKDMLKDLYYNEYNELDLKEKDCPKIIKSIISNSEEKDKDIEFLHNNLNLFAKKGTKINYNLLRDITYNIPIKDRTIKSIASQYNSSIHNELLFKNSTVYKSMVNLLQLKYKEPVYKGPSFKLKDKYKRDLIFLYRLIIDLESRCNLLFYDETGISHLNNKKRQWFFKYESTEIPKRKIFPQLNLLMIISNSKILYSKFNYCSTDAKEVTIFFKEFLEKNDKDAFSNPLLILDNASYHSSHELNKIFKSKFKRILFISPYNPSQNQIEYVFEFIKRKLKEIVDTLNFKKIEDYIMASNVVIKEGFESEMKETFIRYLRKLILDINNL